MAYESFEGIITTCWFSAKTVSKKTSKKTMSSNVEASRGFQLLEGENDDSDAES